MLPDKATDSVVVYNGETSKKFIEDEMEQATITPFVSADMLALGLGLSITLADGTAHTTTWELMSPRTLIRSWRAVKMLEALPNLQIHGSLSLCWTLAKETLASHADTYPDELGTLYGDYEQSREMRANILASYPTPDTLASMLAVIKKLGLKINTEEIGASEKNLEAPKVILKRLIEADVDRHKRLELRAKTVEGKLAIFPRSEAVPKRRSLFERVFG